MAASWEPVPRSERDSRIDALRGIALFGVLLVNLMDSFRVPLFEHMSGASRTSSPADEFIDALIAVLVTFKAFTLFSFLFGVGSAIQSERASARGVHPRRFLARRFALLFLFGVAHIVFIWNGDILALYGVCGALLVVFMGASNRILTIVGAALVVLPHFVPLPIPWPSAEVMRFDAVQARRIYATAGYVDILVFRCREAWTLILPLWLSSLPRTAGLMLLGVASWRSGLLNSASRLSRIFWIAAPLGVAAAILEHTPIGNALPGGILNVCAILGLSFAYGSGILLWAPPVPALAAVGRMALTNYLAQSIVLSLVFYGFGLGLFGRLNALIGVTIAVSLYLAQAVVSYVWLARFRYGPFEWVWRSLTYGRSQPMRRALVGSSASNVR